MCFGNYFGFLSSFDYFGCVVVLMQMCYLDVFVWVQVFGMVESECDVFFVCFDVGGCGVGFVVLGGVFLEGVDLVGEWLIGVFIVMFGLLQVNDVNEQMWCVMDVCFGNGYDYMYLYLGLQKVVQVVGCVICIEYDEGVVYLIDDCYW